MLRHSGTKEFFDVAVFKPFAKLFYRGDAKLLIDTQRLLGIEPRILADTGDSRTGLRAQALQLAERTCKNDLPDRARNGVADTGIGGKIRMVANKFIEAPR